MCVFILMDTNNHISWHDQVIPDRYTALKVTLLSTLLSHNASSEFPKDLFHTHCMIIDQYSVHRILHS